MNDWYWFLEPADEWFVVYAMIRLIPLLQSVTMFCIGHTVELCLKGVVAKETGKSVDEIIEKYGHDIKKLWRKCKSDQNFMPDYEIRDSVLKADLLEHGFEERLEKSSKSDFESYCKHRELYYLASRCLPDLKYGAVAKKGVYGMSRLQPNPYWIGFMKELRRYVGYPLPGGLDFIKYVIDKGKLPPRAAQYLEGLYG